MLLDCHSYSKGPENIDPCRRKYLVEGTPVHGPQLNGGGGHNGSSTWGLEQQSCISKNPPWLLVNLDPATFNLHIAAGSITHTLSSTVTMPYIATIWM